MRDQYYPERARRGGGLFSTLGFIFAVILAIGLFSKMGMKVSMDGLQGKLSEMRAASLEPSSDNAESGDIVVIPPKGSEETQYDASTFTPKTPRDLSSSSTRQSERSTNGSFDAEAWIDRFSETAVQQAVSKGIPAGIALAVGIMEMQSGKPINSWKDFMGRVIEPLLQLKEKSASGDLRNYFKYSANSDRWAQGLGEADLYAVNSLKKTISRYDLSDYDRQVSERLAREAEIESQADYVGREVSASIRKNSRSAAVEDEEVSVKPSAGNRYNEIVGEEVAKAVARKKLKSGQYIGEEDLGRLVEETNQEAGKTIKKNLAFPGRKVNPKHPNAAKNMDITDPKNTQAREELYQRKLKEQRAKREKS